MAKKARKARESKSKVAQKAKAARVKTVNTGSLMDAAKALQLAARKLKAVDDRLACNKRKTRVLV